MLPPRSLHFGSFQDVIFRKSGDGTILRIDPLRNRSEDATVFVMVSKHLTT